MAWGARNVRGRTKSQGGGYRGGIWSWPLHDIAITHLAWCMAYTGGVDGGGVYYAMVVQLYCNRVVFVRGVGRYKDDRLLQLNFEVNQYLVKAKHGARQ